MEQLKEYTMQEAEDYINKHSKYKVKIEHRFNTYNVMYSFDFLGFKIDGTYCFAYLIEPNIKLCIHEIEEMIKDNINHYRKRIKKDGFKRRDKLRSKYKRVKRIPVP